MTEINTCKQNIKLTFNQEFEYLKETAAYQEINRVGLIIWNKNEVIFDFYFTNDLACKFNCS